MDNQVANETDLKTLAQSYLDAFHAHDMDRCLSFFADDATVDFNKTIYAGRQGITDWHKDRFEADLKMVKMNAMTVKDDTVTVDGAVTSKRLAAWRLKSLSGRVTMKFENGKIKYGKLAPRMTNPFNMMREDMGA
ncbi:MAG TPA: nuclear transport factor 2 family protein [Bryobacteraceae bacterium]|nr:nuclear transport factor 2 family protein [Bryobacteraceae bacterium]